MRFAELSMARQALPSALLGIVPVIQIVVFAPLTTGARGLALKLGCQITRNRIDAPFATSDEPIENFFHVRVRPQW